MKGFAIMRFAVCVFGLLASCRTFGTAGGATSSSSIPMSDEERKTRGAKIDEGKEILW